MPADAVDLLARLSERFGVAGFEDEVREELAELVSPYVDEVSVDALGNLLATRRGGDAGTVMLDAHMDEVGFMVSYIEEDGFLRFVPVGGWDERIISAHAMTILAEGGGKVRGVVAAVPPHVLGPEERERPLKAEDLFLDVGARSRAEAEALGIGVGAPAVIGYPLERLDDDVVAGKALDDRAGCAALVETLAGLADDDLDVTVVAAFAVAEEVGLRGARTAAFQVEPDLALALEGTAGDSPGVAPARQPTRLGAGPAITVMDGSAITSPLVVRVLAEAAEAEGIPYQYKRPGVGGTDAGAIQQSRAGVLVGVVSVPCRYIHSPFSLLRLDDFRHAVALTTAFVRRSPGLLRGLPGAPRASER